MSWFHCCHQIVAATLLLSLAILGGSLYPPPAADCHEGDCGIIFVAHDAPRIV